METATLVDSRQSTRTDLVWPVSMWLPDANQFYNATSINISKEGVLLAAPNSTPITEGQMVEINFPRTVALARQKGSFARIKGGKVIRVQRKDRQADGDMAIAIQFE